MPERLWKRSPKCFAVASPSSLELLTFAVVPCPWQVCAPLLREACLPSLPPTNFLCWQHPLFESQSKCHPHVRFHGDFLIPDATGPMTRKALQGCVFPRRIHAQSPAIDQSQAASQGRAHTVTHASGFSSRHRMRDSNWSPAVTENESTSRFTLLWANMEGVH
jgi:hypothetical protein